jgi:5-(carboxyamino)imidazole ribonucleotide synthase
MPTAPFSIVRSADELRPALAGLPGRGVLKTAAWGYDGKGQLTVTSGDDAASAWRRLSGDGPPCAEAVLEGFVDFDCELSVIGVRGWTGEFTSYGPLLNHHHRHILDVSVSPGPAIGARTARDAVELTRTIMEALSVVGVLCVEMFLTTDGRLLINELAPRPHNSGHLTIDAHVACQFEQQVRSICGLPLGSSEQRRPAAMANLLGDAWEALGGPDWAGLLSLPEVKLHLYGKADPRPGRKMGHLTALADSPAASESLVRAARRRLRRES